MATRFALCLSNEGFEAALVPRKIYRVLPDPEAEREGLLRVVDESEEDYLYPKSMFEPIRLPDMVEEDGVLVFTGEAVGDLETAVQNHRRERLAGHTS